MISSFYFCQMSRIYVSNLLPFHHGKSKIVYRWCHHWMDSNVPDNRGWKHWNVSIATWFTAFDLQIFGFCLDWQYEIVATPRGLSIFRHPFFMISSENIWKKKSDYFHCKSCRHILIRSRKLKIKICEKKNSIILYLNLVILEKI